MKNLTSFLLKICNSLKHTPEIRIDLYGSSVVVAELTPYADYTVIEIQNYTEESNGIIYKLAPNEEGLKKVLDFDRADYFNQNMVNPMVLDYDDLIKVLLAFIDLGTKCKVEITPVIIDMISEQNE